MDDFKTDRVWVQEDGRRAMRKVKETETAPGTTERIVELHVEEERPLHLEQRVIEKKKPFVYERVIETLDGEGNIVEQKTESIEPTRQMQMREHIVAAQTVEDEPECDCNVTKDEMIEAIVAAFKAQQDMQVESLGVKPKGIRKIAEDLGTEAVNGDKTMTYWYIALAAAGGLFAYFTFFYPAM